MSAEESATAVRRHMRKQADGCGSPVMSVSRGVIYALLDEADRLEADNRLMRHSLSNVIEALTLSALVVDEGEPR